MSAPQRIGSYRVVSQLGAGATGAVYLAVQDPIARQVAIKVLHAALASDEQQARRFLNEARAVNIVRHPGLVQISDYGRLESGRPYVVMEFLQGQTLRAELSRRGRLPVPEVLGLMADIADALAAAHQHRIVHRDLKPENVMLVPDPAVPRGARVKLLDFGVAKVSGPITTSLSGAEATAAGALLGTPAYMAPEQVQGAAETTDRADVYALGVMCYELLTGQPPFTGPAFAVLTRHVQEAPPPLAKAAPEVPPRVAALVQHMLAKAPQARPAMSQVAKLMAAELAGGSRGSGAMGAYTPEAPPRTSRSIIASAVGFLVTLALLVGGALWWMQRGGRTPAVASEASCPAGVFCPEAQDVLLGRRLRALRGVATPAGPRLWAVGDQGTLLRGEGGRWTAMVVGEGAKQVREKLYALWLDGAEELWIGGADGRLLHRTAVGGSGSFTALAVPTKATITGIYRSPGRGRGAALWISAKDGALVHGEPGSFQVAATGNKRALYAVAGAPGDGDDDVWAVGREGLLLRCRGAAACEPVASGTEETLYAVSVTRRAAAVNLWLAGKGGTLIRHDGAQGQVVATGTERDLKALWEAADGQVFVVGDHGTILRVNAGAQPPVAAMPAGTTEDLDAVFGAPAAGGGSEVWAVGTGGALLHYRP